MTRGDEAVGLHSTAPALRGGLLALLSAALFGISTPLVQLFGQGLGPFSTAALLYVGAAMVAFVLRQPPEREARVRRADLTRLLAMAGFGAVLGPVALAWGLQRTSGSSASLMLTVEAVFTAVLAWKLYGETMDRRVGAAMLLLLAGGAALVVRSWRSVSYCTFRNRMTTPMSTTRWKPTYCIGLETNASMGFYRPLQLVFTSRMKSTRVHTWRTTELAMCCRNHNLGVPWNVGFWSSSVGTAG